MNCGTTDAGVGPQQIAQRLPPTLRLAEKISQLLLLAGRVSPARDFDLDLAAQNDGMDLLSRIRVRYAQFESERRSRCEWNNLGTLNSDSELRHGTSVPIAATWP